MLHRFSKLLFTFTHKLQSKRSYNTGIELVFSKDFGKWYVLNLNVNAYHNQINAFTVENKYPVAHSFSANQQEIFSGNLKFNNTFHLKNTFDIQLMAKLNETTITNTNFKYMYWNIAQQVAHHTVNGCNLKIGDILASGTISGSEVGSYGSLLELTWAGKNQITLTNGETRTYLENGDKLTLVGFCEKDGIRVGFGEVMGQII